MLLTNVRGPAIAVEPNVDSVHVSMAEFATPRFVANVAEARRLRESLPRGEAGAALARVGLLDEHALDGWDTPTAHLAAKLVEVLGLGGPLERLHEALDDFSPDRASHKRVTAAKIDLQHPIADAAAAKPFHDAYESLICSHVAPHVAAACAAHASAPALMRSAAGDDKLWYACVPTLRVQTPSKEHATIRPHIDGMYDLPDGSINFWLPLTRLDASSTLWVESAPGKEDFHPLTSASRFDGRRCLHFSVPNQSECTRVSLDFRCIPGALFEPSGRLARAGYFSAVARDPRGSGAFEPCMAPGSRGTTSMLHGLPHTRTPPGWKQKRSAARRKKSS